jgi:hypothetical protein
VSDDIKATRGVPDVNAEPDPHPEWLRQLGELHVHAETIPADMKEGWAAFCCPAHGLPGAETLASGRKDREPSTAVREPSRCCHAGRRACPDRRSNGGRSRPRPD